MSKQCQLYVCLVNVKSLRCSSGEYCSEPAPIEHGLYMCVKPSTCGLFHVGTEVHYLCYSQYEPRPDDVLVQTCVVGGKWTGRKPVCQPGGWGSSS